MRCITEDNTLFNLDTKVKGVKVTQNVDQYPRLYVTYAPAKFDVATSHGQGEDAFPRKIHYLTLTLGSRSPKVKVTRNFAQYPLHHVTYAPTEFEVTRSKALGGEAFTRNFKL